MIPSPPSWLLSLLPAKMSVNDVERVRSCAGALLGIFLTCLLSAQALGPAAAAIWLTAPMGALAVLPGRLLYCVANNSFWSETDIRIETLPIVDFV